MNKAEEHLKKTAKTIKCGLEFKKAFDDLYDSLKTLNEEELNQVVTHPDSVVFKKHMDVLEDFMKQLVGLKPYERMKPNKNIENESK